MSKDRAARELVVVGAPTSAGSYAPGQEQAPRVLREFGLIDRLAASGRPVRDAGDGPLQVWAPDSATPFAQNLTDVVDAVVAASSQVGAALDEGADVLVIGGNCTIALATMDALVSRDPDAGLLYIDRHFDMNTPESTTDGALDWMGIAHGLDLRGAIPELADAFCRRPLLTPTQICYLGVDQDEATEWERAECGRMQMRWGSNARLAALPAAEAESALRLLPRGPMAVHVDVDVLNFTEAPLSESTNGRNVGPNLAGLTTALEVACHDSRFRVLSIGELNPSRAAGQSDALDRFVDMLAQVF
jgi:arginase